MSGYYLLKNGEFAYNKSYSVGYDFGSIKRLDRYPMGALSTLYICFSLKKHDSDFIKAYFDSLKWYREIYMISAEGARNHGLLNIPTEDFFDTKHYLPENADEQRKIADFLITLDRRIEAQQTLVDNLKKYKRGAIKKLLSPKSCPLKNAKWTTAKLDEIGSFIKGAPLSKADISDDGTPFILYGELYTTYNEVVTNVKRRTQAQVDELFLSREGDVVIPISGETAEEISTASCVMLSDVILAGDLIIYRSHKVDGRIISYLLNHVVNTQIARIAQGKSVVHIQASELRQLTLSYPDEKTQKTLIAFLSKLDDKVINEENALAFLINLKVGLLQQLFI